MVFQTTCNLSYGCELGYPNNVKHLLSQRFKNRIWDLGPYSGYYKGDFNKIEGVRPFANKNNFQQKTDSAETN